MKNEITTELQIMVIDGIQVFDIFINYVKSKIILVFHKYRIPLFSFIKRLFLNINCYSNPPTNLIYGLLNLVNLKLVKFNSSLTI
jgi:hypothetical protein